MKTKMDVLRNSALSLTVLTSLSLFGMLPSGMAQGGTVDQIETEPLTETIGRTTQLPSEVTTNGGGYMKVKPDDWIQLKQERHAERVMRGGFTGSASSRTH